MAPTFPPPLPETRKTAIPSKRKADSPPLLSSGIQHASKHKGVVGTNTYHYHLDMHKRHADRGRYPKARTVDSDTTMLQTRPALADSIVPLSRPMSPGSAKRYLRGLIVSRLEKIPGPPVTLAEDCDGTGWDHNVDFATKPILRQGVYRLSKGYNDGCGCLTECDPALCTCQAVDIGSGEQMTAYEFRDGKVLLKESIIDCQAMIYECWSLCPCLSSCINRLTQLGRQVRLEVFRTYNRGYGLRTLDPILQGQFVDFYCGEVITCKEADLREYVMSGESSYLMTMDSAPLAEETEYYIIDAKKFGSIVRLLNHSCAANCKVYPVLKHHADTRLYDVAIFACRDITMGTELTLDYNPGWVAEMRSEDPNAAKCLCGEQQCRGQLWPYIIWDGDT